MKHLIILDRDGVINFDSPNYIKSPDEWVPIPGSLEAIRSIASAGHTIVIATNQAGVPKRFLSENALNEIHKKLLRTVAKTGGRIDRIYICLHHPSDNCDCRKPRPGMLLSAMQDFSTPPRETYFVGDSESDVRAANASGCNPVLVRTGNGLSALSTLCSTDGLAIYDDLLAFASDFLRRNEDHRTVCVSPRIHG